MADAKLSALPSASDTTGAVFYGVQGGTSKKFAASLFGSGEASRRQVLAANRTYYVRTDGSNSNTGLANTSGGAFLTAQKAWDVICALDLGTFTATIQIADGTYAAGVNMTLVPIGTNPVVIQGNSGTPANVHFSLTGDAFSANGPAQVTIKDLKVTASGIGIYSNHPGAKVQFGNLVFGAGDQHLRGDSGYLGAIPGSGGNYTIAGNANHHILLNGLATILMSGITVTLSGTPAWATSFCTFAAGVATMYSVTFSGSATGKRYQGTLTGVLNSFGAGTASTYFPGNSNGTVATGAQQG